MQCLSSFTFHLKSRWKLFGHILRLNEQCPADTAMKFYFKETDAKSYRGRPRTTIVTTLNNDIKRTVRKIQTFPVRVLNKVEDLVHVRQLAQDRNVWRYIVRDV